MARGVAILLSVISGCSSLPPAPVVDLTSIPRPAGPPLTHPVVWTAAENVGLSNRDEQAVLSRLFTRLEVLRRDSSGLFVLCSVCQDTISGYVSEALVIHTSLPPGIAAFGALPEFLLSIRNAVERRDLAALEPVMAPDFTFALVGVQTPRAAFDAWRAEDYRNVDEVVFLLDQGVVRSPDGRIWSAPPNFALDPTYHGPRAGFRRRPDGRWEWLYLMRGIGR